MNEGKRQKTNEEKDKTEIIRIILKWMKEKRH